LKVERLEWDSSFLGINVGKVSLNPHQDFNQLTAPNDFDLVYFFVHPDDSYNNTSLTASGALLVDEKITFVKNVSSQQANEKNVVSYARTYDQSDQEVIRIGLQSGNYSRFKRDPNFNEAHFKRLYTIWMDNSIDRKIAEEVFVYKEENKIFGVVTVGEKNGRGDIGILAVDESARGKKVGMKLVSHTESYCANKNFSELQVVTQKANTGACHFYEKCGFIIDNIINIYHLWKKDN
jgi:dTDP-4-amino-4,6-dideoxy-D-galactose acyltransferase